MKYWVYLNNEVIGPFDEEKLSEVTGITPETMVCPENISEENKPKWKPYGSIPGFKKEYEGSTEAEKKPDIGEGSPWIDPASAAGKGEKPTQPSDTDETPSAEDKLEILSASEESFDIEKTDESQKLPGKEEEIPPSQPKELKSLEGRISNIETSVSELEKTARELSDKLTFQQNLLHEIKSKPVPEAIPQVELGEETYGKADLGEFKQPLEEDTSQEMPIEETKPSRQTEVTLTTGKKTSLIAGIFKAFFVVVFILILTAVTFFFLARKGLLPEFLNPANYILPQLSVGGAQVPSEIVETPPPQGETIQPVDEEITEVLSEVKEFKLKSGKSLNQAIITANPNTDAKSIDWNVQKIDDDLFSIIVKIPPASQNDWVISYRFDYNRSPSSSAGKMVIPTNSAAQNILNL